MQKSNRNMLQGPLLGNLLSYTVPIILTGVLQLLFNAADLVVVGQFRGSNSVGAVGATGALINLIINLFIGLSVGAGVVVAHGIGSRDDQRVHRTVHTALSVSVIAGLMLTVVGVSLSGTFLTWMGTPEDILPLSTAYMQIYFCGITFTMIYNFCGSIMRAAGDTKTPLIMLSVAGVVNVALNLFFVIVLGMNIEGVALATVISQALSAVLVVLALRKRQDACKLSLSKLRIYKPQLLKMIRIGLPAGIQGSAFSLSNVIIQSSINSFGEIVMSGNAAAANIEGFVYVALNAFYQSAVNFVGQNVGANQWARVKKIFWLCLGCVTVVGLALGLLVFSFGPQLLKIYIPDSPEAISYGMTRFLYVCLPYFLCGVMDVAVGGLRGMGASAVPMITSLLGVCGIRITWIMAIFQLPQFHTLESLYISYPISWTLTLIVHILSFLYLYRKKFRQALSPTF